MARLGDLYDERSTVTISVGKEVVEVQYNPRRYNNRLHAEIQKEVGPDEGGEYVVRLLERLIVGWNIEGDDGTPLPVTYDMLDQLPSNLVIRIAKAIVDDQTDPKARGRSNGR